MFCMPASSVLRVYLGRSMLHLELGIVTAASNPFAMKWTALDNFKWVQNPANTDLFTTSHALHEELKSPDCSLLPPPNIYGSGNCSFRPQVFSPRYLLDNLRELAYMSSFWRKIGIFFKRFRREPLVGFVGMLPPPPRLLKENREFFKPFRRASSGVCRHAHPRPPGNFANLVFLKW